DGDVKARRLFRLLIEPQAWCDLLHHVLRQANARTIGRRLFYVRPFCPARAGMWTGHAAPSEKPSASMSKPRLKRARKFSQAIAAVSSTICRGLKCSRRLLNNSSETSAGVRVRATA